MFYVNFNGIDIPDFIRVKAVNSTVLPEISTNYKNVAGGFGVLETGTTIGGKTISIDVIIVVPKGKTLLQAQRELAFWLKGDNFRLSPLVISDDCEMEYKAKVNGSVDISDLIFAGEGTIEFFVPSGIATSRYPKHGAVQGKSILVDYYGTADAFPVIEYTPTTNLTNTTIRFTHVEKGISVVLQGSVKAGETVLVDCNKKLVKKGGKLSLDMIDLSSRWLKISDRGINTISCNLEGTLKLSYKENWL